MSSYQSGFKVQGDAKAMGKLKGALGNELLIATQNLDSLRVFRRSKLSGMIDIFSRLC